MWIEKSIISSSENKDLKKHEDKKVNCDDFKIETVHTFLIALKNRRMDLGVFWLSKNATHLTKISKSKGTKLSKFFIIMVFKVH